MSGADGADRATDGPAAHRLVRVGGLEVLEWPALGELGVDAAVTTRAGGVSAAPYDSLNLGLHVGDDPGAVIENRRLAARVLGASLDDLVLGAQVHGHRVAVVGADDAGRGARSADDALEGVDGLVTAEPALTLVTLVADCVPVVLADPVARMVAVVHAGWRGTVARVLDAALGAMAGLGARPADVVAALGPAVAPERYQVGPEVAEAARAGLGPEGARAALRPDGAGRWRLDLWEANRTILVQAGVPEHQVLVAALSTGSPGPFFSDRQRRPCGRFALLARLRP